MLKLTTLAALVAVAWPSIGARAQESVTPITLTDTFVEVCNTAMSNLKLSLASLKASGWQATYGDQSDDSFIYVDLRSPDGSVFAKIEKYDFRQGQFEQCTVGAYAQFKEKDLAAVLSHFPSAKGKVIPVAEGGFAALWLLTDQKQFTSLNVLSDSRAARIVTMRTNYLGPSETQP
jgi:hypothetical protein